MISRESNIVIWCFQFAVWWRQQKEENTKILTFNKTLFYAKITEFNSSALIFIHTQVQLMFAVNHGM